jgi:hypothetical protein
LWVVEQEGYSVGLVVGVVDGGTPLADEGDTVIAVANKLGQSRSSQGKKQGKGMGTGGRYIINKVSFSSPRSRNPRIISLTLSSDHLTAFSQLSNGKCSLMFHISELVPLSKYDFKFSSFHFGGKISGVCDVVVFQETYNRFLGFRFVALSTYFQK